MGNIKKISEKIEGIKREIELQQAVVSAFKTIYEGHKQDLDQLNITLKYLEQDWKVEAQKLLGKLEKESETQS